MKINFALAAAILIGITAMLPSDASAAPCDTHNTKFMWRRCMSAEVDKLVDAIREKLEAAEAAPPSMPRHDAGLPA